MALTLKTAISATGTYLEILGADALPNGYVQIGMEYIRVLNTFVGVPGFGEATFRTATVLRGELGSTAATHAAAATVTTVVVAVQTNSPSSPPASEVGSGDGAAQQVTLLGPYRVSHDTPGLIDDNSVPLATVPAGAVVLRTWGELVEAWDGSEIGDNLIIGVIGFGGADSAYATCRTVATHNGLSNPTNTFKEEAWANNSALYGSRIVRVSDAGDGTLVVSAVLTDAGTTGEMDIYALIATPA